MCQSVFNQPFLVHLLLLLPSRSRSAELKRHWLTDWREVEPPALASPHVSPRALHTTRQSDAAQSPATPCTSVPAPPMALSVSLAPIHPPVRLSVGRARATHTHTLSMTVCYTLSVTLLAGTLASQALTLSSPRQELLANSNDDNVVCPVTETSAFCPNERRARYYSSWCAWQVGGASVRWLRPVSLVQHRQPVASVRATGRSTAARCTVVLCVNLVKINEKPSFNHQFPANQVSSKFNKYFSHIHNHSTRPNSLYSACNLWECSELTSKLLRDTVVLSFKCRPISPSTVYQFKQERLFFIVIYSNSLETNNQIMPTGVDARGFSAPCQEASVDAQECMCCVVWYSTTDGHRLAVVVMCLARPTWRTGRSVLCCIIHWSVHFNTPHIISLSYEINRK